MEIIFFISVIFAGMLLLIAGIYGILIISPVFIARISNNLINWLLLWMFFSLFNQSTVKITLPMLPDISFDRVIWIILVLGFFIQIILKRVNFLPLTKIDILMAVFCLVCFISKLLTNTVILKEGLGLSNLLNGFLFPFSIFFISKNIIDNEKEVKKVLIFLLIIGVYLTFTGIFEHYDALSIFVFPKYILDPSVGIHWGRSRGPFIQSAVNGMVLGIIFLTSYYLFIIEQKRLNKKVYGFFIALMPVTIYFTYTRSCWLGIFLSVTITAFYYRGFRKVFYTGMLIGIAGVIVKWFSSIDTDKMSSRVHDMNPIYIRINLFFASIRMFIEKPFFGFGFDGFKEFSPDYFNRVGEIPYMGIGLHQHDTITGIMAELGLSGILPFILIFYYIIKRSGSLYHNLTEDSALNKYFVVLFWGSSIMFLINMVLSDIRFFLFPNSLYFLLAGIIVGYDQRIWLQKTQKVFAARGMDLNANSAVIQ